MAFNLSRRVECLDDGESTEFVLVAIISSFVDLFNPPTFPETSLPLNSFAEINGVSLRTFLIVMTVEFPGQIGYMIFSLLALLLRE